MMNWISVEDELPHEDGITVLVFAPDCYVGSDEIYKSFYHKCVFSGFPRGATKVTHWMPLPDPPQPEGK